MTQFIDREKTIEFVKLYCPNINGETTLECVERAINQVPKAEIICVGEKQKVINLLEDVEEIDHIEKMVIHAIYETVLYENYPPQVFAKLKEKINQRFENYKAITNRNKPTDDKRTLIKNN